MIEEVAKRLFKNCYEAHSFCKTYPNCSMPKKWANLPEQIKQNYIDEATQICQLFELKPLSEMTPREKIQFALRLDKGRLLTNLETIEISTKYRHGDSFDLTGYTEEIVAKTASIKDAENKELGLLLESRVGGVDEINDWGEEGLRNFRQQILPIIKEHCEKLKAGNLGILHNYIEQARQEMVEEIAGDLTRRGQAGIDALPEGEQGFWKGYWQALIDRGQELKRGVK